MRSSALYFALKKRKNNTKMGINESTSESDLVNLRRKHGTWFHFQCISELFRAQQASRQACKCLLASFASCVNGLGLSLALWCSLKPDRVGLEAITQMVSLQLSRPRFGGEMLFD